MYSYGRAVMGVCLWRWCVHMEGVSNYGRGVYLGVHLYGMDAGVPKEGTCTYGMGVYLWKECEGMCTYMEGVHVYQWKGHEPMEGVCHMELWKGCVPMELICIWVYTYMEWMPVYLRKGHVPMEWVYTYGRSVKVCVPIWKGCMCTNGRGVNLWKGCVIWN